MVVYWRVGVCGRQCHSSSSSRRKNNLFYVGFCLNGPEHSLNGQPEHSSLSLSLSPPPPVSLSPSLCPTPLSLRVCVESVLKGGYGNGITAADIPTFTILSFFNDEKQNTKKNKNKKTKKQNNKQTCCADLPPADLVCQHTRKQ